MQKKYNEAILQNFDKYNASEILNMLKIQFKHEPSDRSRQHSKHLLWKRLKW